MQETSLHGGGKLGLGCPPTYCVVIFDMLDGKRLKNKIETRLISIESQPKKVVVVVVVIIGVVVVVVDVVVVVIPVVDPRNRPLKFG